MDLFTQRLTFAGMWAFEDIGVRELETELLQAIPQADCRCEYSLKEEALVIRGRLEGRLAPIAAMISSFIEKQKTKDLLDSPRLRQLSLPSVMQGKAPVVDGNDDKIGDGLVAVDDDFVALIPHSLTRVTKFWLSTTGSAGCFAVSKYSGVLTEVSRNTGTEIVVVDDLKGLQVSSGSESDVNDALEKLEKLEKPLCCLLNPNIGNLAVIPSSRGAHVRIQPIDMLTSRALRRILVDSDCLGQMFVTVLYLLDDEYETYRAPKNLVEPPLCVNETKDSRIWSDFIFQEVGSGDEFSTLESVLDSLPAESQLPPCQVVASHPYLSPEKAKQVKQWVADGSTPEATKAGQQLEDAACLQNQLVALTKTSAGVKKPTGVKIRRPIVPHETNEAKDTKSHSLGYVPLLPHAEPGGVKPTALVDGSRRRWKMQYAPDSNCLPNFQDPVTQAGDLPLNNPSEKSNIRNLKPGLTAAASGNATVMRTSRKPQATSACRPPRNPAIQPPTKHNLLIDDLTPVKPILPSHPPFQFDALPLVPKTAASNSGAQSIASTGSEISTVPANAHNGKLAGLNPAESADSDSSGSTAELLQNTSSSKKKLSDVEARLRRVNIAYNTRSVLAVSGAPVRPCQRPGDYCRVLSKQMEDDLERSAKAETNRLVGEVETRKFYKTMNQKAAKQSQKAKSKAAAKQATLEDAWGMPKSKKLPGKLQAKDNSLGASSRSSAGTAQKLPDPKEQRPIVDEVCRQLFDAMKATLEAAEAFPGLLTFEMQFGLVVVPLRPKTCTDNLISTAEWSKMFQPRTGMAAPTTKFVNRLTVCGSEIDHIVDLKTSRAQGKSRMFEQQYSEYGISYEFLCRTTADERFLITFDEQGAYTIQNPKSILGAVNIHSPAQIWDARAVVGSAALYHPGSSPELEEVAAYMAEHLWIPPNKQISIHTALPKGSKMSVEKVYMKRWTRHRYLRPEGFMSSSQASDGSNMFLQVMEVQDLFIGGYESSDSQCLRARYTSSGEMIQRGKVWFELSLLSSAIETLLKTNASLEIGERTEDWQCSDLFGDFATLLAEQSPDLPKSQVAAAIGGDGIADLLRISKTVVEKMDLVGACNRGPMSSDLRMAVPESQANHGLDFDELESVKEVESVAGRGGLNLLKAEVTKQEQAEKEYW